MKISKSKPNKLIIIIYLATLAYTMERLRYLFGELVL